MTVLSKIFSATIKLFPDFFQVAVYFQLSMELTPLAMAVCYTGWSKKTDTQFYFGITWVIQHRF